MSHWPGHSYESFPEIYGRSPHVNDTIKPGQLNKLQMQSFVENVGAINFDFDMYYVYYYCIIEFSYSFCEESVYW